MVPRKVACPESRKNFIHFAFITWIAQDLKNPNWVGIADREEIDITITIEGVEISFEKFMERIEKHFDELESDFENRVRLKAIELMYEKINELENH